MAVAAFSLGTRAEKSSKFEQLTFSCGVSSPSPHKRAKCGIKAASRRACANKNRSHISCDGNSEKQNSSSKRSRWQLFGGFAAVAGAVALGSTKFPGKIIAGPLDGDFGGGNHGNGGIDHGNGGSGGGNGGGGKHGNSVMVKDEKENRNQVAALHGLASLSSSANGQSLKPQEFAKLVDVQTVGDVMEPKKKIEDEATSFEQESLRGEETGYSQNWLSEVVDTILAKTGLGRRFSKEKERKQLAQEVAAAVLQRLADDSNLAKKYEVGILKRLQREAFSDIMKSRERLDKLEISLPQIKKMAETIGIAKTQISCKVAAGGAFVLMQDISSCSSRSALDEAGLPVGLQVDFTLKTPFRENDMLTTKCVSGVEPGTLGGPFQLSKISYETEVAEDVKFSFVPLGAEAKDVVEIVNPLQDQALTRFARSGPALFGNCTGSAVGLKYETETTMVSFSEYISGWGDGYSRGPLCLSTLAQFIHQPLESFVVSVTGLNRFWPSPPLPSSPGLHWSEMRPFLLSKSTKARGISRNPEDQLLRNNGDQLFRNSGEFQPKGTSMQTVAISGAVDLGGSLSIGGWLQAERGDWLENDEKRRMQWAVSFAKNTGTCVNWGFNVGSSRPNLWIGLGEDKQENVTKSQLLQIEGFARCDLGQGFTLKSGMIYLLNKQCQTPALMLKAEWNL